MSSEVDICNLALGHLGDDATVASLDPPEGSTQAEHCARFYPMARDVMLDGHRWSFNTKRAPLALLSLAPRGAWRYAYAQPADALELIAVLGRDGTYAPQDFVSETNESDQLVIYTNQVNAVLHYTARITDPTRFPPTFTQGLALMLASMLAGPVLKGETGIKAAALWSDRAEKWLTKAKVSDANQQHQQTSQNPSWITNR